MLRPRRNVVLQVRQDTLQTQQVVCGPVFFVGLVNLTNFHLRSLEDRQSYADALSLCLNSGLMDGFSRVGFN